MSRSGHDRLDAPIGVIYHGLLGVPPSVVPDMAIDEQIHRFTNDDYYRLVDSGVLDGVRVELLDGVFVDMSPQHPTHVAVVQTLTVCWGGDCRAMRVQFPMEVGDGWIPEPDFAIAPRNPDLDRHPTSAELVAEVSITSKAHDLLKAHAYAAAGIPVYWLVDVVADAVLEHTDPGPNGYETVRTLRGDDVLDAHVDGMAPITVAALLAG